MGSVAERVPRESPVAVMTVRKPAGDIHRPARGGTAGQPPILGSTALRLVRHAECPVLTVP